MLVDGTDALAGRRAMQPSGYAAPPDHPRHLAAKQHEELPP
jgi:hypothetical protein